VSVPHEEPSYDELDPPIVPLVRTLNEFPGIRTFGSCGGHETPVTGNSAPADEWWILFDLEPADPAGLIAVPTPDAWVSLEFLSYVVSSLRETDHEITLFPYAPPPFLNFPGRMLRFELHGWRGGKAPFEPAEVATHIEKVAAECWVPAEEAWPDDYYDEPQQPTE
jgi:hypothetical protein